MTPKTEGVFERGREAFQRRNYEDAAKLLRESVEVNPEEPYHWLWWGYSLVQEGKYEEAESAFTKSIDLELEVPAVYFYRGLARQLQKKYEEAIEDHRMAYQVNDVDFEEWPVPQACYCLGQCYEALGDYERSVTWYEMSAMQYPHTVEREISRVKKKMNEEKR